MTTSCLFLKPEVRTAEGQVKQMQDIQRCIKPAIMQAGLVALDGQMDGLDGLVVSDISDDLIEKVYNADVLIIDANCYEPKETYQFSPYLYYYMAVGHARGNFTLLVSNTRAHLSPKLITHHTIIYSLEDTWQFITLFKSKVESILQLGGRGAPDNPIQVYRNLAEKEEELAKVRAELELGKAELEREKADKAKVQKPGNQPITFRKLEERRW